MTTTIENIQFLIEVQISEVNMFGSRNSKMIPLFVKINLSSNYPTENLKVVTTEYIQSLKILNPVMEGYGEVQLVEIEEGKNMMMKRIGSPMSDYELNKDKINSFNVEWKAIR
jgi:hypothetical protein